MNNKLLILNLGVDSENTSLAFTQKWINDIKYIEFNELLSSSIGPLALFFGWKKGIKRSFLKLHQEENYLGFF